MFPARVETGFILLVETVINRDLLGPDGGEEFMDVCDGIGFIEGGSEGGIHFAVRVEKVIVGVDE